MLGIHWKRLAAICLLAGLIAFSGGGYAAWAALAFATADTATTYPAPDRYVRISGSDMVWKDQDNSGTDQLYYRNLETGEAKQLTDSSGLKSVPGVGGVYAAYIHLQQNVVLLNIRTGQSITITSTPGVYDFPVTDGRYAAYLNKIDNYLYVYDIENKTSKKIDQGLNPVVADGKMLYIKGGFYDKLQLYDISSGQNHELASVKDGSIEKFAGPAFNGKTAVWLQKMDAGGYQTRLFQTDRDGALPQLLAVSDAMPQSSAPIAIGGHIAAWHQTVGGIDQIAAADLAYTESHIIVDKASVTSLVGIYDNKVALKGSDGSIVLRELHVSGESAPPAAPLVSAVPDVNPLPQPVSRAAGYFEGGGQLASADKSIVLRTEPRDFHAPNGDIVMEPNADRDLQLTKALLPGQKMVSLPWNVSMPAPRAGITLSISYLENRVQKDQLNKLGIYRLEAGSWVYMGGLFEQGTNRIYATIIKPGTYIVLSYDVPDTLVRDYWINKRIAQLNANAPIRVFLDGEEIQFHEAPVLRDGSTAVEFRPIFEKLGLQVDWDDATQTVTGLKDGQSISLSLGKMEAAINEQQTDVPVAPFLNKSYTFVPLRFVGEASGRKVVWDANLKAVYLYKPETEGKMYYSGGALMYEGQLKDGHMNGKGKLYREDGTLWYDAEFKDDQVTGWGTIIFQGFSRGRDRTGEMSIGQFLSGIPEGSVRYVDDSGYVFYEGQVVSGLYNGKGKYYAANELIYEGEFKDNLFNDQGKVYIGGKLYYEGEFADNSITGYGKQFDENGRLKREGEFKQEYMHGKMTFYYPSGAKLFVGQYVDDRAQGTGIEYYENGKLKSEGEYKDGYLAKGTYYYENGEKYVGDFIFDLPDGQGVLYDKNGNIEFQGQFKEGKPVK